MRRWMCCLPLIVVLQGCGLLNDDVTELDLRIRSQSNSRVLVADVEITYQGKETLTEVEVDVMLSVDNGSITKSSVSWPEWKPGETKAVRFVVEGQRPRGAGIHGHATKSGKRVTVAEVGLIERTTPGA